MSKVLKVCEQCGIEYLAWRNRQRFCSKDCQYTATRTRMPRICEICGKRFTETPSRIADGKGRFCSRRCYAEWQSRTMAGDASPFWNGGEIEITCEQCGLVFSVCQALAAGRRFCSSKCYGVYLAETGQTRGPNSSTWKGGMSFEPYPPEFNALFKRAIRRRDNYRCAICRLSARSIHHINYVKDDTNPENCITLCRRCHCKTNYNRPYWQRALSSLLSARLAGASL